MVMNTLLFDHDINCIYQSSYRTNKWEPEYYLSSAIKFGGSSIFTKRVWEALNEDVGVLREQKPHSPSVGKGTSGEGE